MRDKDGKIIIAGTDYVGLSNTVLLAKHNEIIAFDVIYGKVDMINNKNFLLLIKRLRNI